MATYLEFLNKIEDGRPKRLYWLCGTEFLLRELAVERIKSAVGAEEMNYETLTMSDADASEVWDALFVDPVDPKARRLIVVREAQRITKFDTALLWLKDSKIRTSGKPGPTVVFVSSDAEWPKEQHAEFRERVMASTTAQYVQCSMPRETGETRGAEIIQQWGDISDTEARRLYRRSGGDMGRAFNTMRKGAYFNRPVEGQLLTALSPPNPQDDLVESLLNMEKKRAVAALPDLPREEQPRVVGRLAANLDLLARLEPHAGSKTSLREIASRLGVSEQWVRMLIPKLKFYPRRQTLRRVELLMTVDEALQRGVRQNTMEVLIAAW